MGDLLSLSDNASLTVNHTAAVSVGLTPEAEMVTAGESVTYTLTASDEFANEWDVTVEGSYAIETGVGGWWAGNVYTSEEAGTWTVTAIYDSLSDSASLRVNHAAAVSVELTPATATAGESVTYTLTASDDYTNSWDVTEEVDTSFSIETGAGGSWADNVYTSETVGTRTVRAVYTTTLGSRLIDIASLTVEPGPPAAVALGADPLSLDVGQTSELAATVLDAYNNRIPGQEVVFTTDLGSLNGDSTITKTTEADGNAYVTLTSEEAGTATVEAKADSVTDTVQVVFNPVLVGQVTEEGRPDPPDARWEITLTVKFSQTGSVVLTETVQTDASGYFTITELLPGTYNVWVKHSHTLAQCEDGVEIEAGALTTVDFGTLFEGDANDDNLIDIVDFSIWKSLFGGSDPTADFNNDGLVDIVDFSMWKVNFGKTGDPLG